MAGMHFSDALVPINTANRPSTNDMHTAPVYSIAYVYIHFSYC